MELHRPHPVIILMPHQRIGQPLGQPSFARSRRPLQDDVLLVNQTPAHRFQPGAVDETAVVDDVGDLIGRTVAILRFCVGRVRVVSRHRESGPYQRLLRN